jgi:hypothetical protein
MFALRAVKFLTPLALLGALAAVGAADDAKPEEKLDSVALPGAVARGVVSGDDFYAVTAAGRLIDVDLKGRKVKEFDKLDAKLAPYLDVADGKAVVAADGRVLMLDLSNGKTLHSAEFKGDVRGLGFAGGDKAFVIDGPAVTVLDLASGEAVRTIELAKKVKDEPVGRAARRGEVISFQKVDKTLYVLDFFGERLSVVDLDAGKVTDEVRTPYWSSGLRVVGDKVFLAGVNLGYGVNSPQFGVMDLKTKEYKEIKVKAKGLQRIPDGAFDQLALFAGDSDDVVLPSGDSVLEYAGEGFLTARARLPKDNPGRLVGVWQGMALTADKDTLVLTEMLMFGC